MANQLLKKEYIAERLRERYFGAKTRPDHTPTVLVLGVGQLGGGLGTIKLFTYIRWNVVAYEEKRSLEMTRTVKKVSTRARLLHGPLTKKHLEGIDLVIKNPGVPLTDKKLKIIKKSRIPVTADFDILLSFFPRERVIGITGTKGKTTTVLLLQHLLGKQSGAVAVGTPGVSFFDWIGKKITPKWIIAECSSFDLDLVRQSPKTAVITSFFGDHLNRYPSLAAYKKAKANLVRYQKGGDVTLIPKYDPGALQISGASKGRVKYYSRTREPLPIHIHENSAAAAIAAATVLNISRTAIYQRLQTFKPPPGRWEVVFKKGKTLIINDTTASNPGAAGDSIQHYCQEKIEMLHVLTGGEDKNFTETDIKKYARILASCAEIIYLLPGSFSNKLKRHLNVPTRRVGSVKEAVNQFKREYADGAILVFSPGGASFNQFKNEFERGEAFVRAVKQAFRTRKSSMLQ